METIRKVLGVLGLARQLSGINPDAEKDGLKRLAKGILAAAIVATANLLVSQTGSGCILGEGGGL